MPKSSITDPVLLAVTGMSPAILTETIWALAHPTDNAEPVIPARVIAVTTTPGRDQLRQLLRPTSELGGLSPWAALRKALEKSGFDLTDRLRFGETGDDLRVITAADPDTLLSRELADLRTPADNEAAADFLLETVRGIVENPDTPLIASLAGGRKTMGALLYACLTLAGRETDRLTHVLVGEPYESLAGFWFPGQPGGALRGRQGETIEPSKARVTLADVPFIPLRNLFQRELGQPTGSFRRLLEQCRQNVRATVGQQLRLEVETARPRLSVNGRVLELSPREHLVLHFFAARARDGEVRLASYDESLVDLNDFRRRFRQQAPARDWADWRHHESLDRDLDLRDLTRLLSDLRRKAQRAGGETAYLADILPSKGRCALDIPAPLIFLK
jgi:CRISPR-associated protein (TIGR02584 family)